MVNFLLLIEKLIEYDKKTIDEGLTPLKIYQFCSCIRETFCLSYAIRKNNNLFFYFQKEHLLVSFSGNKLRYLGPDERSQAILLLKAINNGKQIPVEDNNFQRESTPGISVTRFSNYSSFFHHIDSLIEGIYVFDVDSSEGLLKEPEILDPVSIRDDTLFIISTYNLDKKINGLFDLFTKKKKNVKFISLTDIKPIENKILYINFRKDHQEIQ
ncbi:MAG: hypothetical protein ACW986_00210 [Promethearchaeota archaeon]